MVLPRTSNQTNSIPLKDVDEDVCVSFTYEDESLDPIGGGVVTRWLIATKNQ